MFGQSRGRSSLKSVIAANTRSAGTSLSMLNRILGMLSPLVSLPATGHFAPKPIRDHLLRAIAVLLIAAAPAGACCRGAHLYPRGYRASDPPPPLAIGDSVMLGAARPLARAGFEVTAREGRFMRPARAIRRRRRRTGRRPRVVLVAIGTNAPARYREIRAALRLLGRGRRLVLVTPKRS